MKELFGKICGHFDRKAENNCFEIFVKNEARLEGWFKGELLCLFSDISLGFECEKQLPIPGKRSPRVDFSVTIKGKENLLELKILECNNPKGRKLHSYFSAPKSQKPEGVTKDIQKLQKDCRKVQKWILLFMYPAQDQEALKGELRRFNEVVKDEVVTIGNGDFHLGSHYSAALLQVT